MNSASISEDNRLIEETKQEQIKRDLLTIAIMIVGILIFFIPIIFSNNIYFYRDITTVTYPFSVMIKECYEQRTLPLWDAYIGFGQPLLADPQAQTLYPLTILRWIFAPPTAFKLHVVLHTCWAALGMWLLCRQWRLSRAAAIMGGLGFVFAGPFISFISQHMHIATAAWLPWVFLTLDRALSDFKFSRALIFGGVITLQLLSAEAVIFMQTLTLSFLYAIAIFGNWRELRSKENWNIIATFFIAGIFSILLGAAYLLPFLRYISVGRRSSGLSSQEVNAHSLHPLLIFELIVSKLFLFFPYLSNNLSPWINALNEGRAPFLYAIYLGAVQLTLALIGTVTGDKRRRRFLLFIAIFTLLLSMGKYLGLFDIFRVVVPIFATMRYPMKFLFITSFAVSLLGAYGFDQLTKLSLQDVVITRRILVLLTVLIVPLLLLTLYFSLLPNESYGSATLIAQKMGMDAYVTAGYQLWASARLRLFHAPLLILLVLLAIRYLPRMSRGRELAILFLLSVGVIELAYAHYTANLLTDRRLTDYQPQVMKYLPEDRHDYRIFAFENSFIASAEVPPMVSGTDISDAEKGIFYGRSVMTPYDSVTHGLLTGMDSNAAGLYPYQFQAIEDFLLSNKDNGALIHLLKQTNNRFILTTYNLNGEPGLHLVGAAFNYTQSPTRVYEIEGYLPQFYTVSKQRSLPPGPETVALLANKQFLADQEVILNDPDAPILPVSESSEIGKTKVVSKTLRSFIVETELNRPNYLVALHSYLPGWQVTVDGEPTKIYRANQLFMAVPLTAGKHRVEFSYMPKEFVLGAIVSIATLIAAILFSLIKLSKSFVKRAR